MAWYRRQHEEEDKHCKLREFVERKQCSDRKDMLMLDDDFSHAGGDVKEFQIVSQAIAK